MLETDMPLTLKLYRRPDCALCDDAEALLENAIVATSAGRPRPMIEYIDITTDPTLEARYAARIPVVVAGGEEIDLVTSSGRIRRLLERAQPLTTAAG